MQKEFFVVVGIIVFSFRVAGQYFPPPGKQWESKRPEEVKLSSDILKNVSDFAIKNEYKGDKDLRIPIAQAYVAEPYHTLAGPVKPRGGPAGMILKNGYLVHSWGDIDRVDMTFSVTKSFLSAIAGLAVDQQKILSVDDAVAQYVWDGTFDGVHNQQITWRHLLTQSSDWNGTLFGMADWADRPPKEGSLDEWQFRKLYTPGEQFEYNDVRVNLLAYSLLHVHRKPLAEVLLDQIMTKIDASTTWRWYGYSSSWVEIDGKHIQSVSGGGHSGGGLFINTRDMARFGLLYLSGGIWNTQRILSQSWITSSLKPSLANASYGFLWWLNQPPRNWEGVTDTKIYHAAGFGGNFIVVDPTNNMVIVVRWLEPSQIGELVRMTQSAIQK